MLACPALLFSQESLHHVKVKIKGGRFFITADTTVFVQNDSLIEIPVNLDYMVSRYPPVNESNTYSNIREKVAQNKVTSSLYQLTFVDPGSRHHRNGKKTASQNPYEKYRGKVIRDIRFTRLDPFGPSISDTAGQPYSWFGRLGNSIHINTRPYILRDYLLVNSGELLDPVVINDNEVLIRNLSFIDDTRIVVVPLNHSSDSVDLVFVTKDKFSFGFNPIIKSFNDYSIKVWNENLYGLGHRIEGEVSVLTTRSPVTRFERGRYTIQNLNGTFIRGDIGYEIIDEQNVYNISFIRGFLPPTIKTAMGMGYKRYVFTDYFLDKDSVVALQDVDLEIQNAFLGHAFELFPTTYPNLHDVYLTSSIGVRRKLYNKRPILYKETPGRYRNTTLFLGSLSLSQNNFYRSNYFYEFGRTEDIPYGFLLNMTLGYETGENYNRMYSGFTISASDYINKFGYLFGEVNVGGYYHNNDIQEGLIDFKVRYASRLFRIRHNNVRLFTDIWYTRGIDRLADEYLRFTNQSGIKGFESQLIQGQQRLSCHIEPVVFTPWVFLGFRFVFFGFASYGVIGDPVGSVLENKVYSGYGLGIRIRNDNLVFNTLELSVRVYPNSPMDQDNVIWSMSGIPTPTFSNFLPKPPVENAYR